MSDQPARGIWLDEGPLPNLPEAAREITDCTVTFTLTPLPLASRAAVVRAMVDAANRLLHASNIYPCPQLRHVVEGLDVNLPRRVHGDVDQSVATAFVPREDPQEATDRIVATLADQLQSMGVQVTNTAAPLTVYVDQQTGREDGHGTQASPFKTVSRARMHARLLGRSPLVRDLSGRVLYQASVVRVAPPPPTPPSPPAGRPAITPDIRFH